MAMAVQAVWLQHFVPPFIAARNGAHTGLKQKNWLCRGTSSQRSLIIPPLVQIVPCRRTVKRAIPTRARSMGLMQAKASNATSVMRGTSSPRTANAKVGVDGSCVTY